MTSVRFTRGLERIQTSRSTCLIKRRRRPPILQSIRRFWCCNIALSLPRWLSKRVEGLSPCGVVISPFLQYGKRGEERGWRGEKKGRGDGKRGETKGGREGRQVVSGFPYGMILVIDLLPILPLPPCSLPSLPPPPFSLRPFPSPLMSTLVYAACNSVGNPLKIDLFFPRFLGDTL